MASIKLYAPDQSAFVSRSLDGYTISFTDSLLLNILIELRVQTILKDEAQPATRDLDAMRLDQAS